MGLPNQRPSGTGRYTNDDTIPGTGLGHDDSVAGQYGGYGEGMPGEYRDTVGEFGYGDDDDEEFGEDDAGEDDLYDTGDLGGGDFDEGEDHDPDIIGSPGRTGEDY
jgi:hypothetical protein